MATPLSVVISNVRSGLQDTREGVYRHSDEKLYRYLNLALADTRRLRPDLFLPDVAATEFNFEPDDSGEDFPLDFAFQSIIVDHIVSSVSLEEDEYVAEGRAAAMWQRFVNKLVGRGA